MELTELLIGIAEIAIAMAGFTGVVVAVGSRSQGAWHPGDRLRLVFLLEASLTAAGFALSALLLYTIWGDTAETWRLLSAVWVVATALSLWRSHRKIRANLDVHDDVDSVANRLTTSAFIALCLVQIVNVVYWHDFSPFLAAILLNVAGAAMQFARLVRSAFRD